MSLFSRARPFLHLGWLLASLNLAVSVYALAGKEPQSSAQIRAVYSDPPAWDFPIYIAARGIQGPALDGPLLGALETFNLPSLAVSTPFYVLVFRAFRGGSLVSASYIYTVVLAFLSIAQCLLVGSFITWLCRKFGATFTSAT